MSSEYVIPHPNIPTTDIGIPKMKEITVLNNENFKALDSSIKSCNTSISEVKDIANGKADAEHTHTEYADKDHTHSMQDINLLQANLDLKAPLVHTHDQYLTEVPVHSHVESEVDGLLVDLANKANASHTHTTGDVLLLDTALSQKADASDLNVVSQTATSALNTATSAQSAAATAQSTADSAYAKAEAVESQIPSPEEENAPNEDTNDGSCGVSDNYSRSDHQHQLNYPPDKATTDMKRDGAGSGGTPSFGTTNSYADLGHSHPLDVPTSSDEIALAKQTIALTKDGVGDDTTNGAALGSTSFYARLDHIHALNVDTDAPPEISTSSGSAGDSKIYARSNHTHKMPKLYATDISYGDTTAGAKLGDHETRIGTLENRPSGGSVNSVDNVGPTNGNVQLNALTTTNYSTTLGTVYQANSAKLTAVQTNIDDNGNVLLSGVKGNIEGHTGNCLVTIDNSGTLGHSGNAAYTLLNNAVKGDGGAARGAHLLVTDLDLGNGLEADSSTYKPKVKANSTGGIEVSGDGVAVKCKTSGGIKVDSNGLSLNVSGTGFVKSENGTLSVPTKQPITLPSGSGYLKSNGTAASVASTIPVADVNFGQGVTNITTANIGAKAVTSVNGESGSVSVTPFPGFGTSDTTASKGNHAHGNITSDGKIASSANHIIVGGSGGALTYGSITKPSGYTGSDLTYLGSIASLFDYESSNFTLSTSKLKYPSTGGHQNNCLLVVNNSGAVVHSGNDMYNALNLVKSDYIASSSTSSERRIPYAKFSGEHNNEKFIKTNTSGQLVETTDTVIISDNVGDGLSYDTSAKKLKVNAASGGGIKVESGGIKLDSVGIAQTPSTFIEGPTTVGTGGMHSKIIFHWPTFDSNGRFAGFSNTHKTEMHFCPALS